MPLQLTVISLDFDSDEKPRTEIFDKEIIKIGRGDSNDIILKGSDVSDKHAELRVKENGVGTLMFISDLGSTNGTKVENDFIKPKEEFSFEFNKRISIGSYLIKPSKLEASGLKDFSRTESGRFTPPKSTLSKVRIPGSGGDLLKGGKTEISSQLQNDLDKLKVATSSASVKKTEEKKPVTPKMEAKKAESKPKIEINETKALKAKNLEAKAPEAKISKSESAADDKTVTPEPSKSALSALKSLAALSTATEKSDDSISSFAKKNEKKEPVKVAPLKVEPAKAESKPKIEVKKEEPKASIPKKAEAKEPKVVAPKITEPKISLEKTVTAKSDSPKVETHKVAKADKVSTTASSIKETAENLVTITLEGDDISDLDFEAIELFDVTGQIRHKGKGLGDVNIEAGELGSTTSDSSGVFSFTEIIEGTDYNIVAKKDGYTFEITNGKGEVNSDIKLTILATKLLSLRGKVELSGKPVAGATINAGEIGTTTSDNDGLFEFKDLSEDSAYEITASKAKYAFDTPTVSGTLTEDSKEVVFKAIALLSISGRVMHKGKPMEGVEIDGGPLGKISTDAQGYYCFSDVPDGTEYSLTAKKGKFTFGTRKGTSGK